METDTITYLHLGHEPRYDPAEPESVTVALVTADDRYETDFGYELESGPAWDAGATDYMRICHAVARTYPDIAVKHDEVLSW